MNNTFKLKNSHEMCQKVFLERVRFLRSQLEADGVDVQKAGRGCDSDMFFTMKSYQPKENFRKALALGRYKLQLETEEDHSILKIDLL